MSSSEYRLRNLRRRLRDLLLGHRAAADPESGVVELADFGKRCDDFADFAAETQAEFEGGVRTIAEEVELAARAAALLETLPKSPERVERQCALLEEPLALIEAALRSEGRYEEEPVLVSLSAIARAERKLFEPLVDFEGRIEESPAGLVDRGGVRRALRRAILEHDGGPFELRVSAKGVLRFGDLEYAAEAAGEAWQRSPDEPEEVKRVLDMREAAPDPALRDFLLVKAVDEALFACVAPRIGALAERARALPHRPTKRFSVRPEAVRRDVEGWDDSEAARVVDRMAARRAGPDWARLPRGAYVLRLFLSEDDALAADLLALAPALRRMEKGEEVGGTGARAERALRALLGMM